MAFDLLRLGGDDLRQRPLEKRREALMRLVAKRRGDGIVFNERAQSCSPRLQCLAWRGGVRANSRAVPGRVSLVRMSNPSRYFNSSPEVIRRVVMMYVRCPLSLRNVEDLFAARGIDISHETVRFSAEPVRPDVRR